MIKLNIPELIFTRNRTSVIIIITPANKAQLDIIIKGVLLDNLFYVTSFYKFIKATKFAMTDAEIQKIINIKFIKV